MVLLFVRLPSGNSFRPKAFFAKKSKFGGGGCPGLCYPRFRVFLLDKQIIISWNRQYAVKGQVAQK